MRGFLIVCMGWLLLAASALAAEPVWPDNIDARLQALTEAQAGSVGIAAMVIEDGRIVGTRMQQPFAAGGVLALPLAMTALDAADHGKLRRDRRLRARLAAMLHGDPRATAQLLRQVGGAPAVHRYLVGLGVEGVDFHAGHGLLYGQATPLAWLTLLDRVQQHGALSTRSRRTLVRLLQPRGEAGRVATAAAPRPWWLRASIGGTRTGLGVVSLPDGRHLAVVVSATGRGPAAGETVGLVARHLWQWQMAPAWRLSLAAR